MHVIPEPAEATFDRVGVTGKLFPAQTVTDKANVLIIETETGHETTIIEHECDFIYYVLDGDGYFEINGTREACSTGDLVVIPAGAKFTYKGKLRMLLVNTPAWTEEQEEVL